MSSYEIQYYPKRNWLGQKRWKLRIVHSNGNTLFSGDSSGYVNRVDALQVAENLRAGLNGAAIVLVDK